MLLKSFDKQGSRNAHQSGVRQLRICVVNVAHTLPCKQLSVSCVTAWHYTVKMSMPLAIPSRMFTGVPTPIRYLGLSFGA